MKVILYEDIKELGKAGAILDVADGYARNYLLPRRLAVKATDGSLRALGHEKRQIAGRQRKARSGVEALAKRITETPVTITVQVGEEDKLFGSVTNQDLADALTREGISVDRKTILLEDPIKALGEFTVPIKLLPDLTVDLKVWVVKTAG